MNSNTATDFDVQLLDAAAVGELLGVGRKTLYDLCRRLHDPLPHLRIGRQLRFRRSDVAAWLQRQTISNP